MESDKFDFNAYMGFMLYTFPNKTFLLDFLSIEARQSVVGAMIREVEKSVGFNSIKDAETAKRRIYEAARAALEDHGLAGVLSYRWMVAVAAQFCTISLDSPTLQAHLNS